MSNSVFIVYKNSEERKAAFIRSLNLRKEWEKKMRSKMQEMGIISKESLQ